MDAGNLTHRPIGKPQRVARHRHRAEDLRLHHLQLAAHGARPAPIPTWRNLTEAGRRARRLRPATLEVPPTLCCSNPRRWPTRENVNPLGPYTRENLPARPSPQGRGINPTPATAAAARAARLWRERLDAPPVEISTDPTRVLRSQHRYRRGLLRSGQQVRVRARRTAMTEPTIAAGPNTDSSG